MSTTLVPRYLRDFPFPNLEKRICDVLVIGSGIAGLVAALEASKAFKVILVTKGELRETATWYAQGGIASAISSVDSPELHFKDTIKAGGELNNPQGVKVLVEEGPDCIDYLSKLGTSFDRNGSQIRLTREAGHSLPRILHVKDSTGAEVESTLAKQIKALENLEIVEESFVVDLITYKDTYKDRCVGAFVLTASGEEVIFLARAVILASGGAGQLYSLTTNPEISTGDGLAMAFRAGADLMDLEFIQFHPTALAGGTMRYPLASKEKAGKPHFLITEALRGEGAILRNSSGERFMLKAHPQAELAPRDVVAREVKKQMIKTSSDHVFLDATNLPTERLKERFPAIWERCSHLGYDLSKDWIPVAPAAHYMIGGVKTDLYGRTTLPGLFASGETACSGLHGANRLASNSLLEGIVFSRRIAKVLEEEVVKISLETLYHLEVEGSSALHRPVLSSTGHRMVHGREPGAESREQRPAPYGAGQGVGSREQLRKIKDLQRVSKKLPEIMMEKVGIFRSKEGLKEALQYLEEQQDLLNQQFSKVSHLELQNQLILARLVASSALKREESRGVHFREDFPQSDNLHWKKHLIVNKAQFEKQGN